MASKDTKERLLDAAELLFADHGIGQTSLRDITGLAAANLASVNYHFGSKDALMEAVFERRIGPVNQERLDLLDALESESTGGAVELERILWAWLAPPFRMRHESGQAGERFLRIVGRIYADPKHSIHEAFLRQFETVRNRYLVAFSRALPDLELDEITRRMHFVLGSLMHTFCWCQQIPCLASEGEPRNEPVLQSLIGFAAAGMHSPAAAVDLDALDPSFRRTAI